MLSISTFDRQLGERIENRRLGLSYSFRDAGGECTWVKWADGSSSVDERKEVPRSVGISVDVT
jgi:hypothetical protein